MLSRGLVLRDPLCFALSVGWRNMGLCALGLVCVLWASISTILVNFVCLCGYCLPVPRV